MSCISGKYAATAWIYCTVCFVNSLRPKFDCLCLVRSQISGFPIFKSIKILLQENHAKNVSCPFKPHVWMCLPLLLTSRAAILLKQNAIMSERKEWEKTEASEDVTWMETEKWRGTTGGGERWRTVKDSLDMLRMPVPPRQGKCVGRRGQRPARLGRGSRELGPEKGPGRGSNGETLNLTAPTHPTSQQNSQPIYDLESSAPERLLSSHRKLLQKTDPCPHLLPTAWGWDKVVLNWGRDSHGGDSMLQGWRCSCVSARSAASQHSALWLRG